MDFTGQIVLLAVLLALSAFFSGAEVALVSLSEARVRTLVAKKRFAAEYIHKLKNNPQRMLSAILIGNNVVNIAAASMMTVVMIELFGDYAVGIATGIMTLLILIFGEITPKAIASRYNEQVAQFVSPAIWGIVVLFRPIIATLDWFLNAVLGMFGLKNTQMSVTEDEIKNLVAIARKEAVITETERKLIDKVFAFDEKLVGEIITPRADMIVLPSGATVDAALKFAAKERVSRIPVYEGQKDNIVGILHLRDLLGKPKRAKVKRIMRAPYVVPETKQISDLLTRFQKRKEHMAIVVEEHGLVIGLVTLEDVLEEIVGDITDETEMDESPIQEDDNGWIVEGSLAISDAHEKLHITFPEGEYTTIGGFMLDRLKHIPQRGEKFKYGDHIFIAQRVTKNRITSVRIQRK